MREPIGIWSLATTTSTVGRFPELRISAICCWRLCTYRTPIAAASAPTRIATRKTLPGFILPPPFHLRAYRSARCHRTLPHGTSQPQAHPAGERRERAQTKGDAVGERDSPLVSGRDPQGVQRAGQGGRLKHGGGPHHLLAKAPLAGEMPHHYGPAQYHTCSQTHKGEPGPQQGSDRAHHLHVPSPDPAHRKRPEEHAHRDAQTSQAVEQASRPQVSRVERNPEEHGRA